MKEPLSESRQKAAAASATATRRGRALRLTTFGAASLSGGPQRSDETIVFGPGKPLALLAYLHCAPNHSASRDRLVDLLWSDGTAEAGQHNLRQAVWYIRQRLGDKAVSTRHGNVALVAEVVCDRTAFVAAVENGDLEQGVALYAGDFLPGTPGQGANDFDEWADLERYRLRRVFTRAAECLVRRRLAAGRHADAQRLARRARDADPHDEGVWALLLEASLAAGDRARAAAEADLFERVLADDRRVAQPNTQAVLRRVRRAAEDGAPAGPAVAVAVAPAMVSREREFGMLVAAWEPARRSGGGRHVHLTGGVGLGKTRLLREFQARLQAAGEQVLYMPARFPARRVSFGFVAEIATGLAQLPGSQGVSPDAAAALVSLNPSLSARFAAAADGARDDEALRRRALAVLELVTAVSEEAPLAVLCDDYHWVDPASIAALAWVLPQLAAARVLWITAGSAAWASSEQRLTERANLVPLSPEGVLQLVSSIAPLPSQTWAARLPPLLHQATAGVPRAVIERLQDALEQGLITLEPTGWGCPNPEGLAVQLATPATAEPLPLLVSPFRVEGPSDAAHLAQGLTEGLITVLSQSERLRVIALASAMRVRDVGDVRARAAAVGAQYVLEGRVSMDGDRLDVAATLHDATTGSVIRGDSWSGAGSDLFALRDQVARAVLDALRVPLNPREERDLGERPAYDCYLRARHCLLRFLPEEFDRALRVLRYGLERGGDNALLYATTGMVYWQLVFSGSNPDEALLRTAEEYAEKASALEPDAPHSHALAACIAWSGGRVRQAVTHFQRALACDPANPEALAWLGCIYGAAGKMFAAHALIARVLELDPLSSINHSFLGFNLMVEGRFEEALGPYRLTFELDKIPPAYATYAIALARAGRKDEADDLLATLSRLTGGTPVGDFGEFMLRALRGERPEALAAVTPHLETFGRHVSYVAWHLGAGCALVGESDSAFAWLRHAVAMGFVNHPFLLIDPLLANLRADDRWPQLAEDCRQAWEEFEV